MPVDADHFLIHDVIYKPIIANTPITINAMDNVLYLFGTMNFSRIDISIHLYFLIKILFRLLLQWRYQQLALQ